MLPSHFYLKEISNFYIKLLKYPKEKKISSLYIQNQPDVGWTQAAPTTVMSYWTCDLLQLSLNF